MEEIEKGLKNENKIKAKNWEQEHDIMHQRLKKEGKGRERKRKGGRRGRGRGKKEGVEKSHTPPSFNNTKNK